MKSKALLRVLFFMLMIVPPFTIARAQSLVLKIPDIAVTQFKIDPSGAVYLRTGANTITKTDSDGDSIGLFNEVKKYGELADIVTVNPLKTLLFYRNYSTIVILDKYFKTLSATDLRKHNIYSISGATLSYDNHIWIFDDENKRLIKVSEAGALLMQSEDFRVLFDEAPTPTILLDKDGYVYLYDAQKGLYTFDYYGSFKSFQPAKGWWNFNVFKGYAYGCDGNHLYEMSLTLPIISKTTLPFIADVGKVQLQNNQVFVLKDGEIISYPLTSIAVKNEY